MLINCRSEQGRYRESIISLWTGSRDDHSGVGLTFLVSNDQRKPVDEKVGDEEVMDNTPSNVEDAYVGVEFHADFL